MGYIPKLIIFADSRRKSVSKKIFEDIILRLSRTEKPQVIELMKDLRNPKIHKIYKQDKGNEICIMVIMTKTKDEI